MISTRCNGIFKIHLFQFVSIMHLNELLLCVCEYCMHIRWLVSLLGYYSLWSIFVGPS
jgi:hypothetical protein